MLLETNSFSVHAKLLHTGSSSQTKEHMGYRKVGCIAGKRYKDILAELHTDAVYVSQIAVVGTKQGNDGKIPAGKLLGSSFA